MDEILGTMSWLIGVSLVLGLLLFACIYGCAQQTTQGQLTPPPPAVHRTASA